MGISKEDVLEYISGLSVLELCELVAEFEEKFGVSAKPVVAVNNSDSGSGDSKDFDVCRSGIGGLGGFKAIYIANEEKGRDRLPTCILKQKTDNNIGYFRSDFRGLSPGVPKKWLLKAG